VKKKHKKGRSTGKWPERQIFCVLLGFFAAFLFLFPTRIRFIDEQLIKLENTTRDLRMSLRQPKKLDNKIIVVGLTDLEHFLYGREINTREAYQLLLQILQKLKVKAVLFDILFEYSKPVDSTLSLKLQEIPTYLSYKFLTESVPISEVGRELFKQDKMNYDDESNSFNTGEFYDFSTSATTDEIRDKILDTIDRLDILDNERIEAFKLFDDKRVAEIDNEQVRFKLESSDLAFLFYEGKFGISDFESELKLPPEGKMVMLPSNLLMLNCNGLGFINLMKTREDIVRRVPLIMRYRDSRYPELKHKLYLHLDLVFLCDYYGVELNDLKIEFGKYIEFKATKNFNGIKRIPIDESGNVIVNFREGDPFLRRSSYPLHQLLHFAKYGENHKTRINPEDFKDAIVIVGELNPGGTDVEPIPITPAFPMVGIHASLINMILHDDYVKDIAPGNGILLTFGFGLLIGFIFVYIEYKPATLIVLFLFLVYSVMAVVLFSTYNLFIPYVRPAGTILLSLAFILFYTVGIKDRERRKVKNIFMKSVSPRIGEEILKNYDNQAIWGEKKLVTIFFVDIRGFTKLSEILSARELVDFLDVYYDTVSRIIFSYDGVVNKFIGDAVLALFGAPIELPDAELQSIRAAVEIQAAVSNLNMHPSLVKHKQEIGLGIGISTGDVVVGTVGKKKIRIEYTALGDNVNIANRLQGKASAGEILVNGTTYKNIMENEDCEFLRMFGFFFEHLPPMYLRGKEKQVKVYKVVYNKP
jgi:class 3 adenylate cyclase/CHASE2 domain-containing sensor protein